MAIERRWELRLADGAVATWMGVDGADAARRYVDVHRGATVVAVRSPRFVITPVAAHQIDG